MPKTVKKETAVKPKAKVIKKVVKKEVPKVEKVAKKVVAPKEGVKTFAVVDINATQLLVEEGKTYEVKKIDTEGKTTYVSDKVLLVVVGDKIKVGKPYVTGAKVTFDAVMQFKGPKLDVFKYKSKSRYRRSYGVRAHLTKLTVKKIDSK
ncbi:50S ribosomal protein L21 [Candidatus Dojkabacteria bacterium]|jgi:large subunit ribosomal protein L21|nr:50S ribosomal protein L21 [Candidatus Dojkabacteria bacterium]